MKKWMWIIKIFFVFNSYQLYSEIVTFNEKAILKTISQEQQQALHQASLKAFSYQKALEKKDSHPILEITAHTKKLEHQKHYPTYDVTDPSTQSLYYYHAHRDCEHGHLHIFLRKEEDHHLVAISFDEKGIPIRLFLTNQWVTAGPITTKEDILTKLNQFNITHDQPSYIANQWIKAFLNLYQYHIQQLYQAQEELFKRDRFMKEALYNNQHIEVIVEANINYKEWIKKLQDKDPSLNQM